MKKRAIIVGILFGIGVWGLSGCKNAGESTASMEDNVVETTETLSEESVFPEDLALEENAEPEELMHESRKPATVLEDESAVYFCGGQRIVKWNKATQQTEIVWIKDETQVSEDAYAFREGKGILIGDKIYFIESWLAEPANPMASLTEYALSVISTDGNLYQQIEKVSGEERLLLLDGILYFACDIESGALEGYVVGANGELLVDKGKVVTMPANVPQGYTDMSYNDNGIQILTAQESAYNLGYYMLRDENYSLCRVNQDTGEKEIIPRGTVEILSGDYLIALADAEVAAEVVEKLKIMTLAE